MGTHFFTAQKAPGISVGGSNLQSRSINALGYASRSAGLGAQKDIAAASALGKSQAVLKKADRSSAYPKGPKV
jgi:hypothetical protein